MIEEPRNSSYSQKLDSVCRKNLYSRFDLERIFCGRSHLPGCRKLNLQELPLQDNSLDLYKKLVAQLRRYNDVLIRKERPILPTEQAAHQFVFQSLRAIAFESKEVQKLNLDKLDRWFVKAMTVKHRGQEAQQPAPKKSQNKSEEIPVISMETTMRIKDYSRRHLEVHTGILRTVKPQGIEEKKNKCYEDSVLRTAHRFYTAEVREFREKQELAEVACTVKNFYKHKHRLVQNLMNCREYVKPDKAEQNQEIWNIEKMSSLHNAEEQQQAETEEQKTVEFEVLREPLATELDEKDSMYRASTAIEELQKHKFILVEGRTAAETNNTNELTIASRIRTAEPTRFRKAVSRTRDVQTKQANRNLSQTQYIKNKLHHSLSKTTLTNQVLFQGLNEPNLPLAETQNLLPQNGSSLMINPFFDTKKKASKR